MAVRHTVTLFTNRQLSRCGKDVKSVVKAEGCQRQALYNHFTDLITPLSPGHLCCSNRRQQCVCDGEKCSGIIEVFIPVADEPEEELPGSI